MQPIKRISIGLGALFALILTATGVLPQELVMPLTLALGATVTEEIKDSDVAEARKVPDYSRMLTKLKPSRFPMDTIMRRLGTEKDAKQTKVQWEEQDHIPRSDTVNGTVAAGTSPATVTVDNGSYWRVDDMIYHPDSGQKVLVTAISSNDLTVYRIDGASGSTFPNIAEFTDGDTLIRYTNSKEEHSTASDPRAVQPTTLYNYTQIEDTVVGISGTKQATETWTIADEIRQEDDAMFDFRWSHEWNLIFGTRSKTDDPGNGNTRTTMGGILEYISSNDFTYTSGSLTESDLIDLCKDTFSGNSGSPERVMFNTPNLTAEIDKILINSSTLQSSRDEEVLGVSATRLHSTFGDLFLVNHQGLEEAGKSNFGLIVDPAYVKRRPLRPMKRKQIEANDIDGEAVQWLEEYSFEVRYEETHATFRDSGTDSAN